MRAEPVRAGDLGTSFSSRLLRAKGRTVTTVKIVEQWFCLSSAIYLRTSKSFPASRVLSPTFEQTRDGYVYPGPTSRPKLSSFLNCKEFWIALLSLSLATTKPRTSCCRSFRRFLNWLEEHRQMPSSRYSAETCFHFRIFHRILRFRSSGRSLCGKSLPAQHPLLLPQLPQPPYDFDRANTTRISRVLCGGAKVSISVV